MLLLLFACSAANHTNLKADPSGGWLSYARYDAPNPTDVITKLSAKMVVPETPTSRGGSPAFWFGVQTNQGDGALIQPIMAKWLGHGFFMFQEIFDWTDMRDKQSRQILVKPGDIISASVEYQKGGGGLGQYIMNMTSKDTGEVSDYTYDLLPRQKAVESTGYFVLEHQPSSCSELPPNGRVMWSDIAVEVNGKPVSDAKWVAMQEEPKCSSKTVIINSTALAITWDA